MSENKTEPGGFAQLPKGLLTVWPYLPEHHMRVLPLILSFMPNCWPKQRTLAALAGVGRQSINETIGQMADAGVFVVLHRKREKDGGNSTCDYRQADWDNPSVRESIIDWYRRNYPKTPLASKARTLPLSSPEDDRVCRPQGTRGAVASSTRQGVSSPEGDSINVQANSQAQELRACGPVGADAPAFSADAVESREAEQVQSPVASPASSTQAPKGKRIKGSSARTSTAPLSDVDKVLARSSPQMMKRYLLWGAAGLRECDDTKLTPSAMNWRVGVPADQALPDAMINDWTIPQLAGAWWSFVSYHRAQAGEPLTLPNVGRLLGSIKHLLCTRTRFEAYAEMRYLLDHWELVRFEMAWAKLTLDESIIGNEKVLALLRDVHTCSPHDYKLRYEKLAAAKQAA
jgi:hypothetical protein